MLPGLRYHYIALRYIAEDREVDEQTGSAECMLYYFYYYYKCTHYSDTHTHNRLTALFPGPPGWAGARRELLDFMVQGKINRGRHTDHPAGCHSIRTNQCLPPPSPHFFTGRMLFLPPNQQCQSTEGNSMHWRHCHKKCLGALYQINPIVVFCLEMAHHIMAPS